MVHPYDRHMGEGRERGFAGFCRFHASLFPFHVCAVVRRDEWVSVDSKRIQPKFHVGEKLMLRDSVNKESEGTTTSTGMGRPAVGERGG